VCRNKKYIWGCSGEKTQFEGSRHRWEDNIKMHLIATGWKGADWVNLVWDDKWQAVYTVKFWIFLSS
jgi:hypothetical protein